MINQQIKNSKVDNATVEYILNNSFIFFIILRKLQVQIYLKVYGLLNHKALDVYGCISHCLFLPLPYFRFRYFEWCFFNTLEESFVSVVT